MLFNDIAFRFNIAGAYQTSFNKRRTETCMDDFHVVKTFPSRTNVIRTSSSNAQPYP